MTSLPALVSYGMKANVQYETVKQIPGLETQELLRQ